MFLFEELIIVSLFGQRTRWITFTLQWRHFATFHKFLDFFHLALMAQQGKDFLKLKF